MFAIVFDNDGTQPNDNLEVAASAVTLDVPRTELRYLLSQNE